MTLYTAVLESIQCAAAIQCLAPPNCSRSARIDRPHFAERGQVDALFPRDLWVNTQTVGPRFSIVVTVCIVCGRRSSGSKRVIQTKKHSPIEPSRGHLTINMATVPSKGPTKAAKWCGSHWRMALSDGPDQANGCIRMYT